MNKLYNANIIELMKSVDTDSIDLILSDIAYGICYDKRDVVHSNKNNVDAWDETVFDGYNQLPDNLVSMLAESIDNELHPTQKPLALMKLLIELTTKENQLMCDLFMGSGTVPIGALQLDMSFIGIEKEQEYYKTALRRLEKKYDVTEFSFSH